MQVRHHGPKSRLAHMLAGLGLALFLTACGSSGPSVPLPALSEDAVIVAFGDSLTHGTGAAPDKSYPAVLESLTGRKVINAGVPGEGSGKGRKRLLEVLDQHRPDLLLLCHGGNDLIRNRDRDGLRENLLAMVQAARDRGAAVVLIGVPRPALFLLQSDEIYADLATEMNIPLEGKLLAEIIGNNDLKYDVVHPNAKGYRILAEGLAELLRERGAI